MFNWTVSFKLYVQFKFGQIDYSIQQNVNVLYNFSFVSSGLYHSSIIECIVLFNSKIIVSPSTWLPLIPLHIF